MVIRVTTPLSHQGLFISIKETLENKRLVLARGDFAAQPSTTDIIVRLSKYADPTSIVTITYAFGFFGNGFPTAVCQFDGGVPVIDLVRLNVDH